MRRLGASALLPALPRAQSLALAEALILMEIEDPPPHAWIPCVLDGEEGEEEETKVGAQGRRPKRRWTDGRKNSGPIFCRRPEGSETTKVRVRGPDDPQTVRSGRTSHRAFKPAQGLERGRDGGGVKVMTVIRAFPIVE